MGIWLRFRQVRKGSFRDGREKLLVDFLDDKNNSIAGDWCPAWRDVEKIVLAAVDVEQTNDGDYVEMLHKVEQRLATRLPKLGVARHEALLHAYDPPTLSVEILDTDRPGWGPRWDLPLSCPVPQRLLDLVIENGLRVRIIVREQRVTDIRVNVAGDGEVSLAGVPHDADVHVVEGMLLYRRDSVPKPPF